MNELFFNDKNLKILIDCFRRNSNIDQNLKFNDFDDSSGFSKKIAITTCIKGIMEDSIKSKTWSKKTAESYCTCAVENLYAKGYTFKDIGRQPNQNNKLYNEVIAPCFNQALKDGTEINNLNNYHSEDIVGDYFSSKVSLLDYFKQGYKIKISVGGKVKYYLFDTGQAI